MLAREVVLLASMNLRHTILASKVDWRIDGPLFGSNSRSDSQLRRLRAKTHPDLQSCSQARCGDSLARAVIVSVMTADEEPSRAEKFAAVVKPAAARAGYTGRGAIARLARDSGLPETTISRMLAGERIPDPRSFEALASALQISIGELLVGAEIVSTSTLHQIATTPVRSHPISVEEAADDLGITDPVDRQMFAGMVERLRRLKQQQSTSSGDGGVAIEN